MTIRKFYVKAKVYLYSKRNIINTVIFTAVAIIFFCYFVNSFIFGKVIGNLAYNDERSGDCVKALKLYNVESGYYSLFHFSGENKDKYLEMPYKIASCQMKNGQSRKSAETMHSGLIKIQKQYGVFSREAAYFTRKYLIKYYLDNNKVKPAVKEFKNLLAIYKKIGYVGNEMSDMVRLMGDIYYAQKQYDIAIGFYNKSYETTVGQKLIDYDTFLRTVNRMAEYSAENTYADEAIQLYKKTIEQLKNSGKAQDVERVNMLIALSKVYEKNEKTKDAVIAYEEAIAIINTLPRTNYLRKHKQEYLMKLKDLYNKDGQFHKANEVQVELTKVSRFSFF